MNPYNYKKPAGGKLGADIGSQDTGNAASANMKVKSDSYLEHKILNAKPEELTLMLYDGLVKFIKQTMLFNDQRIFDKSNNSNLRAQAIIQELRSTLNMEIPMSENLENLYLFMMDHLVSANISKKNSTLEEVLEFATDLRNAWKEAMGL